MGGSRIVINLILIFFPVCLFGQANRYIVFFKDKSNSPYSIDQPEAFLSAKSISRRQKQNIKTIALDLPVNPAYVNQVKSTGARTFFTSRWMNCVLVEMGADSIGRLQSLSVVSSVELVAPGAKLLGGRIKKSLTNKGTAGSYASMAQLQQLGIDEMQSQGFHGENIFIAVLDGGFVGVNSAAPFQHLFQDGQVKGTFDFVGNTGNVYQYHWHGTEVLSIIAADIPGAFTGGAAAASFYLFVTEDVSSEYRIEEYNWLFAAEKADSAGVDIISTSLGYNTFYDSSMDYSYANLDGKTAIITRAANEAILRGMIVVCSAGNEGDKSWHYITTPSDAIGILSVGAVDINGFRAPFSSVGPSADNRIKPEVVALGSGNTVIDPGGFVTSNNGTSFSSPLIASLAAGVWQAYPQLSAQKIRDAIIQSGNQAGTPDNLKGYGLPNFTAIKNIVETKDIDVDITVNPNPASETIVTVTFKKPTNELFTVIIFDCMGQNLSQSTLMVSWQDNPFQLSLYGIAPGMYYIQFKSQTVSRTIKLIKA